MAAKGAATTSIFESGWLIGAVTLSALACTGIFLRYVFLAGCAGDLKTGLGEPMEALRLEEIAMQWLAGSTALFGLAIALCIVNFFRHSLPAALIEAVFPGAVVGVLLWLSVFWVEGAGVRGCVS